MKARGYPITEYRIRLRLFAGLVCAVLGVLCIRLVQLQIVDAADYTGESASNAVRAIRVLPARGVLFDRHAKLLVDNEPTYTISFTPRSTNSISVVNRSPGLSPLTRYSCADTMY